MAEEIRQSAGAGRLPDAGPFLAKVVSHLDPNYMGLLEVQLMREVGNDNSDGGQLHQVKYLSPFYGVTSVDFVSDADDTYNNTQKSYGFWMVPPDVGTMVMVIFVEGDPRKGYWMGCVLDDKMNFMMPGNAATSYTVDEPDSDNQGRAGRIPVAEYNKIIGASTLDATVITKPKTPFYDQLVAQGLILDDIRGVTTSSARREVPSMVFGISTPGPVDKQPDAKQGKIGKSQNKTNNAFVSRLGGSSFVMDDGDDKWLRRTAPTDGPPDYAGVEHGETDGDVTRPHNELIRLRTRTGHQILMHNSEDLIYITNSRGTAWIELSSDGKIDIFAQDSISVRTQNDFNFYADRDFNIEVGRNFNLKVANRHQTEVGGNKIGIVNGNVVLQTDGTHDETVTGQTTVTLTSGYDLNVTGNTTATSSGNFELNSSGDNMFTASGSTNIKSGGNHLETASQIHMNGPGAADAGTAAVAAAPEPLSTFDNPTQDEGTVTSIMLRVPTTEPYPHHENLDATMFKPDATDRESGSAISPPDAWKSYSTMTDTFERTTPPQEEPEE